MYNKYFFFIYVYRVINVNDFCHGFYKVLCLESIVSIFANYSQSEFPNHVLKYIVFYENVFTSFRPNSQVISVINNTLCCICRRMVWKDFIKTKHL